VVLLEHVPFGALMRRLLAPGENTVVIPKDGAANLRLNRAAIPPLHIGLKFWLQNYIAALLDPATPLYSWDRG